MRYPYGKMTRKNYSKKPINCEYIFPIQIYKQVITQVYNSQGLDEFLSLETV